jgi:hypothetical protein
VFKLKYLYRSTFLSIQPDQTQRMKSNRYASAGNELKNMNDIKKIG